MTFIATVFANFPPPVNHPDTIPTLIVFKDGEPVERLQGVQPKAAIKSAIAAA